jgi:hypothetical protein
MKENGKTTRLMARAPTLMLTVQDIKVTGETISSMDLALKHGQTVLSMKVNILKVKKMARASSHLPIAQSTMETLR